MSEFNATNNSSVLPTITDDCSNMCDPFISSETLASWLFAIDCIITPVVTTGGVVGNLMSLVVLLQHNMRNGVNICLATLSISDSLFLITAMIRRATSIIAQLDITASQWYFVKIFGPMLYLNFLFSRITTYLTVLITVNRFIAVVFPFRMKFWCTAEKMLGASIFICIFCTLVLLPTALVYKAGEVFIPGLNVTKPYLAPTQFLLDNTQFIMDYSQTFLIILFRHLPAVVLIFLNIYIWIALKRSQTIRNKMSGKSGNKSISNDGEKSITKMLLIISGLFLVCLIPGSVSVFVNQQVEEFSSSGAYKNSYALASAITLLLEVINSSVNFIVYMALSTTFANAYKKLLCCWIEKLVTK